MTPSSLCSQLSAAGTPPYRTQGLHLSPKVSAAENLHNLRHPAENEPEVATHSFILKHKNLKQNCVGNRRRKRNSLAKLEWMRVSYLEQTASGETVKM